MNDKYDNRLFSILEDVKTLPNFLDVIFGFLYRRTDYYEIAKETNIGVGLPEGIAQKLLWQAFKKYETLKIKDCPSPNIVKPINKSVNVQKPINKDKSDVRLFETYNGAVFENYAWSQTITDLDVQIKIPDKVTCKQLQVDIAASNMLIKQRNSDIVYLKGDFCKKCKVNETVWSLDDHILQIHLEKSSESWWDCLLTTEPKLDFNKMDCSRPFHELSEEARAKIEQLTWDQERRQQGLPTSEQLNLERTLQKAWNAQGSPFTGDYDPTKVSLE